MRRAAPSLAAGLAALIAAAALSGCGNERGSPPDLDALAESDSLVAFTSDDGSVSYEYPRGWITLKGQPPQISQTASGSALLAVFAYRRNDLATDPGSIEAYRRRLVDSLIERDPGFQIIRTQISEVNGDPAIEIRGRGRIAGNSVESRSLHVYQPSVEFVIDAYARPPAFSEANSVAFAPIIASIELDGDALEEDG